MTKKTAPRPQSAPFCAAATALVLLVVPASLFAQGALSVSAPAPRSAAADLPDAPPAQAASPKSEKRLGGTMSGTVMDAAGDVLAGASVTLENMATGDKRIAVSDTNGYFSFIAVDVGTFKVTITAKDFASWSETNIPMEPAADLDLPHIVLQIASATTEVNVVFSQYELAEEQVKIEEKQRVFGVVPNFYTSYVWHAAPLTPRQKFRLALRSSIDPFSFVGAGVAAGIEQSRNTFSGYGQGAEGYAKRFGAAYTDEFMGTIVGSAIFPVLLHQDPRYYYKGTGTITSRALYAISTTVITRGDNGKWQPNYSGILGNLAAAGISNLYYPASDQDSAAVTIDNALIGTAEGAISALIQEFLLRHLTPSANGRDKP